MNGDGFDDVIVGALRANAVFSGAAYIVYGGHDKRQSPLQTTTMGSREFLVMFGIAYSWFGYSVSGAGLFVSIVLF